MLQIMLYLGSLAIWVTLFIIAIRDLCKSEDEHKKWQRFKCIIYGIVCITTVLSVVFSCIDYSEKQKVKLECKQVLAENKLKEVEIYPEKLIEIKDSDNYEPMVFLLLKENVDSCYAFRRDYQSDSFFLAIRTKNDSFNWYEFKFKLEYFDDVKKITNLS